RLAYTDAVDAFREKIIRNEFVVAVEIVIADIELNHTILKMSGSTHDIDRLDMMFVQLLECLTYHRILNDLSKRTRLQIADDLVNQTRIVGRFDDQHQLHRGLFKLDRGLSVRELGAINNVCPMDQLVQVGHR